MQARAGRELAIGSTRATDTHRRVAAWREATAPSSDRDASSRQVPDQLRASSRHAAQNAAGHTPRRRATPRHRSRVVAASGCVAGSLGATLFQESLSDTDVPSADAPLAPSAHAAWPTRPVWRDSAPGVPRKLLRRAGSAEGASASLQARRTQHDWRHHAALRIPGRLHRGDTSCGGRLKGPC